MKFEIDEVRWKNRFPSAGVSADVAHKEIEKIKAKGDLTPEAVIDAARAKRNPLHKLFEWSDDVAAEKYRLIQAGRVLRSLEVVYVDRPKEPTRCYEVEVKKSPGKPQPTIYTTHEEAVQDPIVRERLLAESIKALMQWRRRFRLLSELDRVFNAIDEVVDEIGGK